MALSFIVILFLKICSLNLEKQPLLMLIEGKQHVFFCVCVGGGGVGGERELNPGLHALDEFKADIPCVTCRWRSAE